ncbi:hypothetical protein LMG27952_07014 [Paraburkholderia hiiakae]|uniref:Uncharacterized protein n=1 Tax=Paraburkholderia hiiakae TaxID=1081782 RepID=A0ABN7IH44_9BURK|nr:hypothetical protein [Paraburkholderia hiiakae]CAD6559980.1 hypothetical protein LMG27952_07014 [Paraburkholderia hiiakae]
MSKHRKPHHHARPGSTNNNPDSLVKIVITNDSGDWIRPNSGAKFYIDEQANFPEIKFEFKSNAAPPYQWEWKIEWNAHVSGLREQVRNGRKLKQFTDTGSFSSSEKIWKADLGSKVLGGKLIVTVKIGNDTFKRTVMILAKNPSETQVTDFLAGMQNVTGFDRLIAQEGKFKNFINADNEPVVAGDAGYGMTQLTHPSPTYEQAWSWKANILGGAALYQEKQAGAKSYLGQHGRHHTDDQLSHETISRWNGGSYHKWDEQSQTWVRTPEMLCDPSTGNMGWDTTVSANQNKSVSELHERDKDEYKKMRSGQTTDHPWKYSGVCYADHIEGSE